MDDKPTEPDTITPGDPSGTPPPQPPGPLHRGETRREARSEWSTLSVALLIRAAVLILYVLLGELLEGATLRADGLSDGLIVFAALALVSATVSLRRRDQFAEREVAHVTGRMILLALALYVDANPTGDLKTTTPAAPAPSGGPTDGPSPTGTPNVDETEDPHVLSGDIDVPTAVFVNVQDPTPPRYPNRIMSASYPGLRLGHLGNLAGAGAALHCDRPATPAPGPAPQAFRRLHDADGGHVGVASPVGCRRRRTPMKETGRAR